MTTRERDRRVTTAFKLLEGVSLGRVYDELAQTNLDTVATVAFHNGMVSDAIVKISRNAGAGRGFRIALWVLIFYQFVLI